ncbi:MAG: hypothetical protein IJ851_06715 [Eubacterium sp.]|nr:hypothetical protein [Eubacterium sp.]
MYYFNQNDYPDIKYDRPNTSKVETIATSGCGVCACCMVVDNLADRELYSVAKMAKLALTCGARDNYGTNITTLLKAVCKANSGFSYTTTNDENALIRHLKAGGMAICNQGDSYNVFSTSGHFVVAYRMVGSNIDILDPQMYDGKYDAYDRPNRIVKKTKYGCIVTKSELAKATADRSPAYFLVSYKGGSPVAQYGNAKMKSAQSTYCDSNLEDKIGSVSKGERVLYLGTGEGRPMIAYKISNGYKVGFVKKDTVDRD